MPKPTNPDQHTYLFADDMKFLQKAVIYHPTDQNRFLILKRAMDMPSRPGDWDFAGGNVLYGENHQESLLREIDEETGLSVGPLKPIQIITRMENSDITNHQDIYFLLISFICKAEAEDVKLSHEHTEFKWVTIQEFEDAQAIDFLLETAHIAEKEKGDLF